MHALGAQVSQAASRWHGWAEVHGHARAKLARGIDLVGQDGAGDEVTAREVDGGALPRFGVLGGHGDVWASVGWSRSVSMRWGSS
jgi:hypothetical protein